MLAGRNHPNDRVQIHETLVDALELISEGYLVISKH